MGAASAPRPPKDRFTSLDALALARELRALGRARVDKVFDATAGGWSIGLRSVAGERAELWLKPGEFGVLVPRPIDHAEAPGDLARVLRRLLAGTLLGAVSEPGGDRILDAEFGRSDGSPPYRLVAEFFGGGNLMLVHEGTLVAVARPRAWAHRTLRVGVPFVPAPASPDPWSAGAPQLEVLLLGSAADRVSTLAARAGFSGPVAEELLLRAGVDPSAPARSEAGSVANAVRAAADTLLDEIGERPAGYLYRRATEIVDVTPYPSERRRRAGDLAEERRERFGDAAAEFYLRPQPVAAPPRPRPSDSLARQRARQLEAVERLSREVETRTAQANRLFERYPEAEAARQRLATAEAPPETAELELGDLKVPVDPRKPLEASARALYAEAKVARTKLLGAREALAATERRLAEGPTDEAPAPAEVAAPRPSAKPLWFERFRWFVSSEGVLVLAGRDATSNDLLVKRYLREGDRYVHADLHGAASVVVKLSASPAGAALGEPTLREAGQFAVAYSKAWRAGHASADAFWVLPDQVSKTGASGEFVARGAWVIHGTKHVLRDLPLELALGSVDHEGRTLWTVAPPESLAARGRILARLAPDDERERTVRERELAKEFGIPLDLLARLLPAGGLRIRRA